MSHDYSQLTGSTSRLLRTFIAHSIPCEVLQGDFNVIRYQTKNGDWRQLKGMVSEKLPLFSKFICDDKWWTAHVFEDLGLLSPETALFLDEDQLAEFLKKHGSLVVKPRKGAHGHGVSINVSSKKEFASSVRLAKKYSKGVLVQQQLVGKDTRILVIGGKVVSALERRPPTVVGDGVHTVEELIHLENQRPQRGKLGIDTLVEISMPAVRRYITKGFQRSVPDEGIVVRVTGPSNQSIGGSVHDFFELLDDSNKRDILKITNYLQMPIAGVDCIITDNGHYFLEINASPGIAIHDDPTLGIESGCLETYMKLLYEDDWWRV